MGFTIGSLIAKLGLDASGYTKGIDDVVAKTDSGAGGIVAGLSKIGVAAGAGLAVGAAAIVGVGVAAASAFIPFENSMNEVFTLLPNLSEQAMGQMSKDVLKLSKDMGVLPNKVVPALYQAISAGVPADNVFEFLEIAQRAAVGGVADLATAVDGITSVVNAYGSDVVGAAQASDLMFTAVRLGKTDFQQLSQSLFNVVPVASSLGVEFGDVTAALAAMTAQGVPTSVATTQLRQAFVELSKGGSAAAVQFEELSGKSFRDFIAAGGNVQGALQLMEKGADAMGVGINELFGSVEAGAAALSLTGKGTETFTANLDAMAEAAGATDTAYNQMDKGISRTLDKIKAQGQAFLITVGDRLAPVLAGAADAALTFLVPAFEKIADFVEQRLVPVLDAIMPGIEDLISAFEALFTGDPGTFFELLWTGLYQIGEAFGLTDEQMRPFLDGLENVIQTVAKFVADHGPELKAALIAIGAVLAAAAIASGIAAVGAAIVALANPITAVILVVGLLAAAWEGDWGGIRTWTLQAIEDIKAFIGPFLATIQGWWEENGAQIIATVTGLWETVTGWFKTGTEDGKSLVDTALAFIMGLWDTYGAQIIGAAQEIWYGIVGHIDLAMLLIQDVIDTVTAAIAGDWDGFWAGIKNVAWTLIMMVHNQIQTILGAIATLFGLNATEVSGTVSSLFDGLMLAVFEGLDWIKGAIETALAWVRDWWETHGDSVMKVVNNTWDTIQAIIDTVLGVIEGIVQAWTAAREGDWFAFGEALRGIVDTLWAGIQRVFSNTLDSIKTIVMVGLTTLNSVFSAGWETLKRVAGETVDNLWNAFINIDWIELGTAIIRGVASGLTSGAGIIAEAAKGAANSAYQAAKGFLKIACPQPSPVFEDLGIGMGLGVERGLEETMADLASHMPAMLGDLTVTPRMPVTPVQAAQPGNQYVYHITLEEPQTRARGSLETLVSMLEMSHG